MYRLTHSPEGRACIQRVSDGAWIDKSDKDFLEWNSFQVRPLDTADKEPARLPVDSEMESLKAILEKPEKDLAIADLKGPLIRLLRERYGVSSKS